MVDRKLILVSPHGFCAGVRRAIAIAEAVLQQTPKPVYCLKQIVHNRQVIDDLTAKGMVFVQDLRDVPRGATILFSAHGVPPAVCHTARDLGLNVVDATCPFVTKIHQGVLRHAARGWSILLIGHRDHDEIIGVAGEAPDRVTVIESATAATTVQVSNPAKVIVMSQTTLSLDEVAQSLAVLRERFPSLKTQAAGDVCYASRNRQEAVQRFAQQANAFIILGAENSSNSNRLVEVARHAGCPAHLVSTLEKLAGINLDPIKTLGLTAGASTPEAFVTAAIAQLQAHGFPEAHEFIAVQENVCFPLPAELCGKPTSTTNHKDTQKRAEPLL